MESGGGESCRPKRSREDRREVVKTVAEDEAEGGAELDAEGAALSGDAVAEDGEDGGIAPDSTPGAAVSDRPHCSLEEPGKTLARRGAEDLGGHGEYLDP
jgi:hypothetical protein